MATTYGTVMIARIAVPFDEVEASVRRWASERRVPGFVHEDVMLCDDGVTMVMSVFFADEASYRALANDPAQAEWWSTVVEPMLDGEVRWLDGHWRAAIDA
jgi:hypothetical protein